MIISSLSLVLHAIGIHGAIKYKPFAVAVSAVGNMLSFAWSLSLDFIGVALTFLFLHPHVVLIMEIRSEVMAPYNYGRVKTCCDCCE
jgi:hypothetical protein